MIFNISEISFSSIVGNSGIKILIHERGDIARPNFYGFRIPPGRNAYIGIRKRLTYIIPVMLDVLMIMSCPSIHSTSILNLFVDKMLLLVI